MFNRTSFMFSVAVIALQGAADLALPMDTTTHHMRRGNGHKITGFDGDLIRQMNRTNGVGAPSRLRRNMKQEFLNDN